MSKNEDSTRYPDVRLRDGFDECFATHHNSPDIAEAFADDTGYEFRVSWIPTHDGEMEERLAKRWSVGALIQQWARRPGTYCVLVFPHNE